MRNAIMTKTQSRKIVKIVNIPKKPSLNESMQGIAEKKYLIYLDELGNESFKFHLTLILRFSWKY